MTFDKRHLCKCQNDVHHKNNEAKTTTSIHPLNCESCLLYQRLLRAFEQNHRKK